MGPSPDLPVTVVITVYKGLPFLPETLHSVLSQTLSPTRILLLSDGCPQNSTAFAEGLDPRVQIVHKPNTGVSDTRNLGTALAQTEWIHFMDHDDLWTPDHLARQAATLAANPGADACYTGRRHLVEQPDGSFQLSAPIPLPPADRVRQTLLTRCPFTPAALLLRRSLVRQIGGFRSQFNGVEDWDFFLRLSHAGARFVHSPDQTLHYRVHRASATNNPLPNLQRLIGTVEQSILPHLHPLRRPFARASLISRLEGEAAILLRENGLPGARSLMLRAVLRQPFHTPHHLKVLAHMLLRGYPVTQPVAGAP